MVEPNGDCSTYNQAMIKNVVIVGGGFAGWYAAAALQLRCTDLSITLIESPNIPRLRVGESLGFDSLYAWKRYLGLDNDTNLMRQTGAIYKFGVHNINFYNDNESVGHGKVFNLKVNALTSFYNQYEYPDYYEHWSKQPGELGILDAWVYLNKDNVNKSGQQFFNEVSDSSFFCSSTSVPFNYRNEMTLRNNDGYSYHLDAEETVGFIKSLVLERNTSNKFTHVTGNVSQVVLDEDGKINQLVLDSGQKLTSDVFFDCTGFARVLAKHTHSAYWKDFDGYNNCAWVCPTRYLDPELELSCSTKIFGEDYGWRFLVNLYHRQGNGYVFNDQLIDPAQIGDYLDRLTQGRQLAPPRLIKWNPGLYKSSWVANCITLGVSGAFFDPWDAPTFSEQNRDLEEFIQLVAKYNHNELNSCMLKEQYNQKRNQSLGERQLRISIAHGLSNRSGPYWDYMRQRAKDSDVVGEFERLLVNPNHQYNSRLPFYWQQFYIKVLALTNTDVSSWRFDAPNDANLKMARSFFEFTQARNNYIKTQTWPNAYLWLREHRFNGATSQEIYEEFSYRNA